MLAILLAHVVGTAAAPALVRRWGRAAFYPLGSIPLVSLGWVVANWPTGLGRRPPRHGALGARTVDGHRAAVRFAQRDHVRAGVGDRRPGLVLLRRLLPAGRVAHRNRSAAAQLRREDGRLRRSHVRADGRRQRVGALRVLGNDDGVVVPVDRPLRRTCHQPPGRHPGIAGHHCRMGWPCWSASSCWATPPAATCCRIWWPIRRRGPSSPSGCC